MDITIRKAKKEDLEFLVDFNMAMAQETEKRSLDRGLVIYGTKAVFEAPERGFYIVAEAEGRVTGSLLITFEWSDWRNATFWWIQSVYVHPEVRRRGVYRAMYDYVLREAVAIKGVCGIRLYAKRDNEIAHRVYERLGMKKTDYDLFEADIVL